MKHKLKKPKQFSSIVAIFIISFLFISASFTKISKNQNLTNIDTTVLKLYADGDYFFTRKMNDSALAKYTRVEAEGFNSSYLSFKKGKAELLLDDYQSAIVDLSKSLSLRKSNTTTTSFSEKEMYIKFDVGNYIFTSNYVSLKDNYYDIYLNRGIAKNLNDDDYGAIVDLNKYHKIRKDSTDISCFYLGTSLMRVNKMALAKKYFDCIINIPKNVTSITLADAYLNRGIINYNSGKKQAGCQDWSKASELGNQEAFKNIKTYCK